MNRKTIKTLAIAGLLAISAGAQAQDDVQAQNHLEGVLVNSKWAGACGMVRQLVDFNSTTQMPGGDEFVVRFLTTETARLGTTPLQFLEHCKGVADFHREVIKAVKEDGAPQAPGAPRDLLAPSGPSLADRILGEQPATRPAVSRRTP
jgi:hypothetical protein